MRTLLLFISRTLFLAAGLFQVACSSPEQSYLGAQPGGNGAADHGPSSAATPSKVTLASYPSVSLKCGTQACVK